MAFYTGDIPAEDIVIEPARGEELINLAPFQQYDTEIALRTFDGDLVEADFVTYFEAGTEVEPWRVIVEWPSDTVFATAGLYTLTVTLNGVNVRERLAPIYFVAQDDDGWHTIDTARSEWASAPLSEYRLYQLLELAKQQIISKAPPLDLDTRTPLNYKAGQLMQARNLYNAGLVEAGGEQGSDNFVLRVHPLDWMVEQVINPKQYIPAVG